MVQSGEPVASEIQNGFVVKGLWVEGEKRREGVAGGNGPLGMGANNEGYGV